MIAGLLAALLLLPPHAHPPDIVEPSTLWPMYQRVLRSPCEWLGYSFGGPPKELAEMREAGGEICGLNRMWIPTAEPGAPNGCGTGVTGGTARDAAQEFVARRAFCGVGAMLPTEYRRGSVTLRLERVSDGRSVRVSERRFVDVADETVVRLNVRCAPGRYRLRLCRAAGNLGIWMMRDAHGPAIALAGVARAGWVLEYALIEDDGALSWRSDPSNHAYTLLSSCNVVVGNRGAGLGTMFWVGNWNNGAFPYYPDWFYQRYPSVVMRDASGSPISASILGPAKGWPSIEHPVVNEGTERYIREFVGSQLGTGGPVYWALGGEALYPNYLMGGVGWPDYGEDALAHFHAWLRRHYGDERRFSLAWGRTVRFIDAVPPAVREATQAFADWVDFRFDAMSDRMRMHYAAVRSADPGRPAVTANHGNIFWGDAYAALGADLPLYGNASDGFEMGQIMEGDDPGYLNLWYASALAGLGKIGAPARLAYRSPDPAARGGGRSFTPEAARRYCMEALGAGWWHLGLIQWSGSLPDGEWGVRGTPAEPAIRSTFSDIKRVRPALSGSWPVLPRVALYLPRYQWIQYGWNPEWTTLHTWAIQHQIDHAVLWEQQLLLGEAEPYLAVVVAHASVMTLDALRALAAYVRRGGTLVVVGEFATVTPAGWKVAESERTWLMAPRVRRIASLATTPDDLGRELARAGVRPFCSLTSQGATRWELDVEPLAGRHSGPIDLAPARRLCQSFRAPGIRLESAAFCTPTYSHRPSGFRAVIRLRRGDQNGTVLAERSTDAEEIVDNAWTGLRASIPTIPGETLTLEMLPDRPIPIGTLGVWSSGAKTHGLGDARVAGVSQEVDLELRLRYAVQMPSAMPVETFVLHDGSTVMVVLMNLSDDPATVVATPDPALLPFGCDRTTDALTGAQLGSCSTVEVTVPGRGYRIVRFAPAVTPARGSGAVAALRSRSAAEAHAPGGDSRGILSAARLAADALRRGDAAKALGLTRRIVGSPRVRVLGARRVDGRGATVRVLATFADGRRLRGGIGTLRLVPLAGVTVRMHETSPGVYLGVVSERAMGVYDYGLRQYRPYHGWLQAVVNVWSGRYLAQADRRLK